MEGRELKGVGGGAVIVIGIGIGIGAIVTGIGIGIDAGDKKVQLEVPFFLSHPSRLFRFRCTIFIDS